MLIENDILRSLLLIAADAASEIMAVYRQAFDVEFKTPKDPVTEADRRANRLISERLAEEFASIPVVAEETPAHLWGERRNEQRIFFVDPVDGTREFVERNDNFSIMIGLVDGPHPSIGVVWAPALRKVWAASPEDGAFSFELQHEVFTETLIQAGLPRKQLVVSAEKELKHARFLLSPSFDPKRAGPIVEQLAPEQRILVGGAGLKAVAVAEGRGDIYATPRHQGSRWDCCAPEAIVRAAGGRYTDARGLDLDYRSEQIKNLHGIVATNQLLHDACLKELQRFVAKGDQK